MYQVKLLVSGDLFMRISDQRKILELTDNTMLALRGSKS